MQVVDLH